MPMTMKKLGRKGRFANQLFQYAYLRIVSKGDYGCAPWIGQVLFGHQDPAPGEGRDISGRFPKHSSFYAPHKEFFRSLFQPVEWIRKLLEIDRQGRTLIGLHLRRGDYGTFKRQSARWCFVAPAEWYVQWLNANLDRFDNPAVIVVSDEREKVIDDFSRFPVLTHLMNVMDKDFYEDFYALTQCDILLISNSTFGFAASMLNERATEFYRPRLSEKRLIPYDPWNAPLVFTDEKY